MCTHSRGSNWKSSFERAPWLVTKVMDNGMCVVCDCACPLSYNRILYPTWYTGSTGSTCLTLGAVRLTVSTIWVGVGQVSCITVHWYWYAGCWPICVRSSGSE